MTGAHSLAEHFYQYVTQELRGSFTTVAQELQISPEDLMKWTKQKPPKSKKTSPELREIEEKVVNWMLKCRQASQKMPSIQQVVVPLEPMYPSAIECRMVTPNRVKSIYRDPSRVKLKRSIQDVALLAAVPTMDKAMRRPWNLKRRRKSYPHEIKDVRASSRFPSTAMNLASSILDECVPIRIDVDVNGIRYRDSFTWNLMERCISPEGFARHTVNDLQITGIDTSELVDAIAISIYRQLHAHAVEVKLGYNHLTNALTSMHNGIEQLHLVRLDIRIRNLVLHDQFEWDLYDPWNSPELFASKLCREMELPQGFESAIAFAIREQLYKYKMALLHPELCTLPKKGTARANPKEGKPCVWTMPPVEEVVRPPGELAEWQPVLSELTLQEIQYLNQVHQQDTRCSSVPKMRQIHVPISPSREDTRPPSKDRGPRQINAFIAFCQSNRTELSVSNPKKSTTEISRMLGDIWRGYSDEDKEKYNEVVKVENNRRLMEYLQEQRTKEVMKWVEAEGRRLGLISRRVLDVSPDHCRALFLQEYMRKRHEYGSL